MSLIVVIGKGNAMICISNLFFLKDWRLKWSLHVRSTSPLWLMMFLCETATLYNLRLSIFKYGSDWLYDYDYNADCYCESTTYDWRPETSDHGYWQERGEEKESSLKEKKLFWCEVGDGAATRIRPSLLPISNPLRHTNALMQPSPQLRCWMMFPFIIFAFPISHHSTFSFS